MVSVYAMCVSVMECTYSIEKCVMVSVYVIGVMVMECTVQYREMCYGMSICNVCNGDVVYSTV